MEKNVDCVRLVREAQLVDKECLDRLAKLAEAVEAGDAKEVKLYAHAIKGRAGNVGAK